MASILLLLQTVHENVHDFTMKPNYSKPKIFTGSIDIKDWKKLSTEQKNTALSKDWYVYFSFRNPVTNQLERQSNIKAGANRIKTKEERYKFLLEVRDNLELLLKMGFNPYTDNTALEEKLSPNNIPTLEVTSPKPVVEIEKNIVDELLDSSNYTIEYAFEYVLNRKKNSLAESSYKVFKSRINSFLNWIKEKNEGALQKPITTLSKKMVISYLNEVLDKTSATSRNNTRGDLSAFFQTLVDDDILTENFIKNINVLKSKPERNKTYSSKLEFDILEYLKNNDPILLLFVQFISYNFLRPIEVCRLKVSDLNLNDRTLTVNAKNKNGKTKIIPQKMFDLIPDLSSKNNNDLLFTPNEIGGTWETEEVNRRDYFTKRFKEIKDNFNLGKDYGLYSFRHTSITNLYKEFNKTLTPFETKSKLMQITGHQTMDALEKYLRDIDAALPEDYSKFIK